MCHNFPKNRVSKGRPELAHIWRNDVTVEYAPGENTQPGKYERGDILELSRKSLRRLAFVAHNTSITFDTMTTLTYPAEFSHCGQDAKRHLQRFLKWSYRNCGITAYLWALEFQKRGAPHFHIFTFEGCLVRSKKAVSAEWFEIVGSSDEKHLLAGTRVERLRKPDAAGRYAAKYASKPWQKRVPENYWNVGRFWGHSRNVKPEPLATRSLEGWGDLITEFDGWEYQEKLMDRKPIAVLYNAGRFLQDKYNDEQGQDVCL